MSGLAGWIDFSRDLRLSRPLATMMTATLAARGPDDERVWVSERAALGHRALHTGEHGTPQPYVLTVADRTVAACVIGFPLGLDRLAGRLRAVGDGGDESPAALVARAYKRWRGDFVADLAGSFALAVWDAGEQELFLARDQLGGQPLYYTHTPTGLVFASERKTLLAHPEVAPVVTAAGLREVVSHALPTGPIFSGFGSIAAGELAWFRRTGWSRHKYWKLTTRAHTDDRATTVATIRGMLEDSVRDHLPADPAALVATLSGGIDSSAVAALAAAEMRRRGAGPLRTVTVDFLGDNFQPDVMRDSHDAPYAKAAAEFIGADAGVVRLDATDILDPVVRGGMMRAKDWPGRIFDMEASQFLFVQHIARQGGRIAFTGGAGDQLFQGARWSTDPELVKADVFPWVAMAQRHGAQHGFGTALLNQEVLAALDLPTYYQDTYRSMVAQVEHLPDEDDWQRRLRRAAYLVLVCGPLDNAVFAHAGMQMRAPINHPRLVEYAYNIPQVLHGEGGREKALLRAAVADLLPPEVINRRQSATPVSKQPNYVERLLEEFKAMLAEPYAPVHALLDLPAAKAMADQPLQLAKNRLARAAVESALQLNLWLDLYRVRLAL